MLAAIDQSFAAAWNTLNRTAYRSRYRDRAIVIEVARDPVPDESFTEFEKSLRAIGRPELTAITAPSLLSQFREWIRNGESLHAREIVSDSP